ncbi:MATE family efflux transporter [Oscillospiraceae bacterium HV4-5-C5C]|nr:MATE family efflux transporter [Oscillospiraceae bacterium HV4-5-C5C]
MAGPVKRPQRLINDLKTYSARLLPLFLPILVEQFFITIMSVVNTMMSSRLGPEAISAIGTDASIINVANSFFSALGIGGTVVVAQFTGQDDHRSANKAAAMAISSAVVISVLVSGSLFVFRVRLIDSLFGQADPLILEYALQYMAIVVFYFIPVAINTMSFGILRGAGDMKTPMKISIFMNVLNVVLGYQLIYGLHIHWGWLQLNTAGLGVRGAAISMLTAESSGTILVMIVLFLPNRVICLRDRSLFGFDRKLLGRIFGLGLPASAEQLMFNGGKVIVQVFLMSFGTAQIAANSVVSSVSTLILIPGNALATLATTVVGQAYGARQYDDARSILRQLNRLSMLLLAGTSLLTLLLAHPLLGLYTDDPATLAVSYPLLIVYLAVTTVIWPASFVIPAGLRGAGDVKFTMIVSIISMWLLRILMSYVLGVVLQGGVMGIWVAMYIDWVGRLLFFVPRMRGRRWLHQPSARI